MKNISDNELLMLYQEKNENAEIELLKRYNKVINLLLKEYFTIIRKLRIDKKQLYSICLDSFYDALDKYSDVSNKAKFSTFVTTIIRRTIKKEIIKSSRNKNKINLNTVSFDEIINEKETFINYNEPDPLECMLEEETKKELNDLIIKNFSDNEKIVYSLMLEGLTNQEIGKVLNKESKQITNSITRIKQKVKNLLENKINL